MGGGVRDMLLGRPPADFDLATDAKPETVLEIFGTFAIPTGLQHGTVTVLDRDPAPRRGDDLPRRGRVPRRAAAVLGDLRRLARRGSVAARLHDERHRARSAAGALTDPFGGQGDLARRLIRAVGDPLARFREDGLRPMRAVRQAAQLDFEIDPATLDAIEPTLDVFRKVSAERVRDEMLQAARGAPALAGARAHAAHGPARPRCCPSCSRASAARRTASTSTTSTGTRSSVVDETRGDAVVRLGALLHDVGKPRARQPREGAPGEYSFFKHEYVGKDMADAICRRWKLSTADRARVVSMVEHHMFFYTPEWTDGTVRRFVRRVGGDTLDALFALREGDVAGRGFGEDPERELGELRRRIADVAAADAALHVTDLAIDGEDVMRVLGIRRAARSATSSSASSSSSSTTRRSTSARSSSRCCRPSEPPVDVASTSPRRAPRRAPSRR